MNAKQNNPSRESIESYKGGTNMSTASITEVVPHQQLCLADLVAPMTADQFLDCFWQKRPCYIEGKRSKFASRCSWEQVNAILETFHLTYPRLRMSKFGIVVPEKEYLNTDPLTKESYINPDGLRQQFTAGATLILHHADEFAQPLRDVARALEAGTGWSAEMDIIAGQGDSNGLPLHYDANDCFAIQIDGCKKWSFFAPTRLWPLRKSTLFPRRCDIVPPVPPSSKAPTLAVRVCPGDFVYVPRGWWHLVEPEPGPCLSINPTVYSPTAQDFLHWLADEAGSSETCRKHIPLREEEQLALLDGMTTDILARLSVDTLRRYRTYLRSDRQRPRKINLPIATVSTLPLAPESTIYMAGGASVYCDYDDSSSHFRIRSQGVTLHFPRDLFEVFSAMNDGRHHCVADLISADAQPDVCARVIKFLGDLLSKGVISCSESCGKS